MCLKYFVETGAMAVRRVLKRDLKRIAKASGGMSCASSQIQYFMLLSVTMSLYIGMLTLKQLQKQNSFYSMLCATNTFIEPFFLNITGKIF